MLSDSARPGEVILVVADDTDYRELLSTQLLANGYEVVAAGDGVEALGLAQETLLSAVIVDLHAPQLDGHEFSKRLRADGRFRTAPVVMLSGADEPDNLNELIELGGIRYVRRGAEGHSIMRTLRLMIESGVAPSAR